MLSGSGLVIIKKHKITAKKNKEIPSTLEELRYIVNANVGIIKITALIFDFLAMPPFCCQSLIICPNIL